MRILSDTRDNGKVVELSEQEWREFARLAYAVEGLEEGESHWRMNGLFDRESAVVVGSGIEFKGVFGAIRAFYQSKFEVNKLQNLLNGMKAAVESTPHE